MRLVVFMWWQPTAFVLAEANVVERESRRVESARRSPESSARLVTSGFARSYVTRLLVMYGSPATAGWLGEAVVLNGLPRGGEVLQLGGGEDEGGLGVVGDDLVEVRDRYARKGSAKRELIWSVGTSLGHPAAALAGEMKLSWIPVLMTARLRM